MPDDVTLVLGMHRSGTSLCAHMLSLMGLDMADRVSADGSNKRGHWERSDIVSAHDEILHLFARDWHDERHGLALPNDWWVDPRVRRIRDKLIKTLEPLTAGPTRIGFKDPRTARFLPMWHEILSALGASPRFVLCVRDPAQVMRSLASRDEVGSGDAEFRWLSYNAHAVEGIRDNTVCMVPYEDWFGSPRENLNRMIRTLDLGWNPDDPMLARVAGEIVDTQLRHDGGKPEQPHISTQQFYSALKACVKAAYLGEEIRKRADIFIGFEHIFAQMQRAAEQVPSLRDRVRQLEAALATVTAISAD